ncbi:recombinase RecT [Vibrio cholerae]|nr:recombinase RecT [Vibrio cholerae]GIB34663.1 phage recombination protein [Vibrio cholerae]
MTDTTTQEPKAKAASSKSLIGKLAEKFGVDPNKFWETLKATAFRQSNGVIPTNEQMMALLIVADQYGLNPFTKEIYAYPDKSNGIVPVVGVDGWSRIINNHPEYKGMEFRFSETTVHLNGLNKPVFEWIECIIYRKDREIHTPIREYLDEIYREPINKIGNNGPYVVNGPWQTHTRRLARHKVIIQAARIILGYTGIYDEDEADRIINGDAMKPQTAAPIEFHSEPVQSLPVPEKQDELLQDLAEASFEGTMDVEEAVLVEVKQPNVDTQHSVNTPESAQPNEVVDTKFGQISRKDHQKIHQMVKFTIENSSWDTTKDSFKERYSGVTLDYALSEINAAFNREFAED